MIPATRSGTTPAPQSSTITKPDSERSVRPDASQPTDKTPRASAAAAVELTASGMQTSRPASEPLGKSEAATLAKQLAEILPANPQSLPAHIRKTDQLRSLATKVLAA